MMTETAAAVRHPAKFTPRIVETALAVLDELDFQGRILDPFAGTGRVHWLHEFDRNRTTFGVELEPEWAEQHARTEVGNALHLRWRANSFGCIFTSPCYGNRMADHHEAKDDSRRNTYRHALGRALNPDNSGQLQWGDDYRAFHAAAWAEAVRVLRPGGLFLLNVSDHIRKGERQPVVRWHTKQLRALGIEWDRRIWIKTPRNRQGANGDLRVPREVLLVGHKPARKLG